MNSSLKTENKLCSDTVAYAIISFLSEPLFIFTPILIFFYSIEQFSKVGWKAIRRGLYIVGFIVSMMSLSGLVEKHFGEIVFPNVYNPAGTLGYIVYIAIMTIEGTIFGAWNEKSHWC
jgi:hypothetical protein